MSNIKRFGRRSSSKGLINQTPTGKEKWILMKNPKPTLGKIIRHFKARTAKIIHDAGHSEFRWQRSFYEHIVRDESNLLRIREYIELNPIRWFFDEENPGNEGAAP